MQHQRQILNMLIGAFSLVLPNQAKSAFFVGMVLLPEVFIVQAAFLRKTAVFSPKSSLLRH
ncbi:hypothetical protein EFB08_01600 [Rufibacter latericius]|uniref:Uncharacterized protein n=1 Tax=Rufibacter latericius TaxID=2487040 RepID=A0A3M9N0D7_9BACT|nr:hypothetical protein EFB08_01600 [Rufibacter latericius]